MSTTQPRKYSIVSIHYEYDDSFYSKQEDHLTDYDPSYFNSFDSKENADARCREINIERARQTRCIRELRGEGDWSRGIAEPLMEDEGHGLGEHVRDELRVLVLSARESGDVWERWDVFEASSKHKPDLNNLKWMDVLICWPHIRTKGSDDLIFEISDASGMVFCKVV